MEGIVEKGRELGGARLRLLPLRPCRRFRFFVFFFFRPRPRPPLPREPKHQHHLPYHHHRFFLFRTLPPTAISSRETRERESYLVPPVL